MLEQTKEVAFPPAARKCKNLLSSVLNDRLICEFQASQWALTEVVQALRDRAILQKFLLDGYEISSFNRRKSEYPIGEEERGPIHDAIKNFETYLRKLEVRTVDLNMDRRMIHEYSLKYSLETPDAIHLLCATQNSDYLVTIDARFKSAGVKEISVIDPETLLNNAALHKRK